MGRLLAPQGHTVPRTVQIQPWSTCALAGQKGKAEQGEGGALALWSRMVGDNETLCLCMWEEAEGAAPLAAGSLQAPCLQPPPLGARPVP